MANYTVFDEGKIIKGDARSILTKIHKEVAAENKEIGAMNVAKYAKVLIGDSRYFLPEDLFDALQKQHFESEYDRALTYFSHMRTSGVKILGYESSPAGVQRRHPQVRRRKAS